MSSQHWPNAHASTRDQFARTIAQRLGRALSPPTAHGIDGRAPQRTLGESTGADGHAPENMGQHNKAGSSDGAAASPPCDPQPYVFEQPLLARSGHPAGPRRGGAPTPGSSHTCAATLMDSLQLRQYSNTSSARPARQSRPRARLRCGNARPARSRGLKKRGRARRAQLGNAPHPHKSFWLDRAPGHAGSGRWAGGSALRTFTLALATKFGAKLVGFITKSAHPLPQKSESEGAKRCRKRGSGGMPAPRRLVLTFAVAAVRVPDLLRL